MRKEEEKLDKAYKEKEEKRREAEIQIQAEAFERAIKNLANSGDIELPSFIKNLLRK